METNNNYSPLEQEFQSTVAKLLSKENIHIHRSYRYKTASFDVDSRILRLPVWKNTPKSVYDLFIGHEVGHALYTTVADIERFHEEFPGKAGTYNILEDIRIEKEIQHSYPGLVRSFKAGYSHLFDTGFFGTNDINEINEMSLINRLNIRAKTGNKAVIFHDDEIDIANAALSISSVDDIFNVTRMLVDFAEAKKKKESSHPEPKSEPETSIDSKYNSDFDEDSGPADTEDAPDDTVVENNETPRADVEDDSDIFETSTQDSLEKNMENNIAHGHQIELIPPSRWQYDYIIHDYKEIFKLKDEARLRCPGSYNVSSLVDSQFTDFVKENRKFVNSLVNVFEQRKAAYQYSRAKTSQRGVIDVNKLHKYKYDDMIFKSVTQLAEAKSHGMIFMIDFSYSMLGTPLNTILKQTITLINFCKRVNIPFEVYSWTSIPVPDSEREKYFKKLAPDEVNLLPYTTICNLCSSRMNRSEFDRAIKDLFVISCLNRFYDSVKYCKVGGTPLQESLLAGMQIIKDFQKRNNVQETTFMFLSDGEGRNLSYNGQHEPDEIFRGGLLPLDGKRLSLTPKYTRNHETLVKHMRDTLGVNCLGYFVTELYRIKGESNCDVTSEKLKDIIRVNHIYSCQNNKLGFNNYIIVLPQGDNSKAKMKDDYSNDTSKNKIGLRKDFIASTKSKVADKMFVKEFVSTIIGSYK